MTNSFSKFALSANQNYFVFYFKTGEVRSISKQAFSKIKAPVVESCGKKYRVVGCESRTRAKNLLKFSAQGFLSGFAEFGSTINAIISGMGQCAGLLSKVRQTNVLKLLSVVTRLGMLFETKEISGLIIATLVLDLYNLYTDFHSAFEAQGLETIAMAAFAHLIPDKFYAIIRKSQCLTSMKVLDDLSGFHDFIMAVVDGVVWLIDQAPLSSDVKDLFKNTIDSFSYISDHLLIRDMEKILTQSKVCKNYLDLAYRSKSKLLNDKIEKSHSLKDWGRRSATMSSIHAAWVRHIKIINASESPTRVEPNCFIFEGTPGKKKSVVMSGVVEALGETFYSHIIKAVTDGKDFYDGYNNEEIFYVDDIGQNGISQWRTIMNMVSSVKMPLDCAEASNKDTKFFNSSKLLLTTNNFQRLGNGITKQDCIEDIQALFRRGLVFDFTRVSGTQTFIKGYMDFKFFNLATGAFEVGFPENFVKFCADKQIGIYPTHEILTRSGLYSWICRIIKIFEAMKKGFKAENKLTTDEMGVISQDLKDLESKFQTQALMTPNELLEQKKRLVNLNSDLANATREKIRRENDGEDTRGINQAIDNILRELEIATRTLNGAQQLVEEEVCINQFSRDTVFTSDIFGNAPDRDFPWECEYRRQTAINDRPQNYSWSGFFSFRILREVISTKIISIVNILTPILTGTIAWCAEHPILLTICVAVLFLYGTVSYYTYKALESFSDDDPPQGIMDRLDRTLDKVYSAVTANSIGFGAATIASKMLLKGYNAWNCTPCANVVTTMTSQGFKFGHDNLHNSVTSLKKHVRVAYVKSDTPSIVVNCIISGRTILLPAHVTNNKEFILVVYDDYANKTVLVDGELVKVVYRDEAADVLVCKLSPSFPSPFKNCSHLLRKEPQEGLNDTYIVTPETIKATGGDKLKGSVKYMFLPTGFSNTVENPFQYDLQYQGMCGSPLFSPTGGILGAHVAGNVTTNVGVASIWNPMLRTVIANYMDEDKNLVPIEMKSVDTPNTNVIKLDMKMFKSAITKSNIGVSPLYNLYPTTRSPAILDKYGRFTTKQLGKGGFAETGKPELQEAQFAREAVSMMFGDFVELPWKEVVCGNSQLNGLNKDSSNGFGHYKDKDVYIDFPKGELTPYCIAEIEKLETNILAGTMTLSDWEKFFWVETPKDEIRDDTKLGTPRTFKVGTILMSILAKRYFGNFVSSVLDLKELNMVMVGINPIKEWPNLYKKIMKGKPFAGDIREYDKRMITVLQRMLTDEIMKRYKGEKPQVAAMFLEAIMHSFVVMLDDLYLTTHSLASGHFLTAIINSLINRMYTACWYFHCLTKAGRDVTVDKFFKDVFDGVYGDDKVNSIYKHWDILNAVTMKHYFTSLKMDLTDSHKKEILDPFQDIKDITFLKRSFVYHNELKKITCPLDLNVLQSGLSWVDYTKDIAQVMDDKIANYQREIYLHPDRVYLRDDFFRRLKDRNVEFDELSLAYLTKLYSPESTFSVGFGSNDVL